MPQFPVVFDTESGELRYSNGGTSGPRPGGGVLISSTYIVLESRVLSEIDNGRRLDCLGPAVLTIPSGLSAGWGCVVMPPRAGLTLVPAAGVTLNGGTAPITRGFLQNIEVQVTQTSPNAYSVSGV